MAAFWACARLQPNRENLACHCLGLRGFEVYLPRLREVRRRAGRKIEVCPPLFPGYLFIAVQLQWCSIRSTFGIASLIMNGTTPARVPNDIIDEIRSRERGGLVELPRRPLMPGDRVQILQGPLAGQIGLFAGMRAH
jgi:transcriptional antiterminator RfaH